MNNDLSKFSRAQLAKLGREYMAAAQFNSRCGYAAVRINHGEEAYLHVAIDNWLAASPTYTRRMQKAMGFSGGDDVATIFKGLQLECGFSHQYFDVHFEVKSAESGRFWLKSCGALLEAEPRGDDAVKTMCHDIEDPTFDATAVATNPKARMRPVHRPPRRSVDSSPHCEWNVVIEESAKPLEESELTKQLYRSRLAQLEITRPEQDNEPGGLYDYSGEFYEQLHLEQLSHSALVLVCKELALQNHLLIKGLTMVAENHYGRDAAQAIAEFQMIGSATIVAQRLAKWAGSPAGEEGVTNIDAVIAVLQVHPLFQPIEYQAVTIEKLNDTTAQISLPASIAQEDDEPLSWLNLLFTGFDAGLDALVKGINPRAQCVKVEGTNFCWKIEIDENADLLEEPLPVQIAKGTVLYQTQFEDRIQLLEIES